MGTSKIQHYVLFSNHDNGMRLYQELKDKGIRCTIAPTPRAASKCCGISLLVQEEDIPTIQNCIETQKIEILDIAAIEKDINPKRDRYC